MEFQKISNFLDTSFDDKSLPRFVTKKWIEVYDLSEKNYSPNKEIRIKTLMLRSDLYAISLMPILLWKEILLLKVIIMLIGKIKILHLKILLLNIAVKRRNDADTDDIALGKITQVAFKNCAPFEKCSAEIDGSLVDEANFINITMTMYNLVESSDNYSDTSESLWGFKRDEIVNNTDMNNDDNAPSFKYKAGLITDTKAGGKKDVVKIAVQLKYLSNFWRSLEMPLINCKIELSLTWN